MLLSPVVRVGNKNNVHVGIICVIWDNDVVSSVTHVDTNIGGQSFNLHNM